MMLGEAQLLVPIDIRRFGAQQIDQQRFLKKLLLQPQRHRHAKRTEPARRESEIGLEQPLELQKRLFVEGDEVDVAPRNTCFLHAIAQRVDRKIRVMFLAREALFLCGRDDLAVAHDRGSAVVIERRDTERDGHQNSV